MFPMQINKIANEKKKASLILADLGLGNRKKQSTLRIIRR